MSILPKVGLRTTRDSEQSSWTVETLREYIIALIAANEIKYSERFEASQSAINAAFLAQQTAMQTALTAQKLAVDTALGAADRAVTKAEIATEKRFESVNEFRSTLSDQQHTFVPRSESLVLSNATNDKIVAMQTVYDHRLEAVKTSFEKNDNDIAKSLASQQLALTRLLSIDAYETRHTALQRQVNELREARSEVTGRSAGASALWGYLVAVAGIAFALISHFIK